MFFKVAFGRWVDDEEPAVASNSTGLADYLSRDVEFFIEAANEASAREIAKKYEGIETHAYEGLGSLKWIVSISEENARELQSIMIYKDYLPEAIERRRNIERSIFAEARAKGLIGSEWYLFYSTELKKRLAGSLV